MISFTEHPGRKVADIEIFGLSTCPYCRATMEYLNQHDIEYRYVFIDKVGADEIDEVEDALEAYNPEDTLPTIVINHGQQVMVGFNEEKLARLIGAAA